MSKIKLERFGDECELIGFDKCEDGYITFLFIELTDGFISIGHVVSRVVSGVCRFDARLIPNGVHEPRLILTDRVILLPKIIKSAHSVVAADCDSEYVREISLRERRLSERVKELESEIEKLRERIYGSRIF